MKKILLTICLASASLLTFAQLPSFGIKGGANLAYVTNNQEGNAESVTSGKKTTFNAGVFVDFKFGNVSLQPALNYTGEGSAYSEGYRVNAKIYYLQLPINIVYHAPIVIGNIYLGAGPYLAQGLHGKETAVEINPFNGPQTVTEDIRFGSNSDEVKRTQIGADAILGLQLKNGFLININYDLGLSNNSNNPGTTNKSYAIGLSVGYVFL